jgi:hypothetical protein
MSKKKNHTKPTIQDIALIDEQVSKLQIVKSLAINDALHSTDVESIYKAQQYLQQIEKKDPDLKPQSMLLDPQQFGADGYKTKSFKLSYDMLRSMGNVPIIKAIIETRKEQVCTFIEPQKDKYSPGFVIRPKKFKKTDSGIKLSKEQERRIEELTEFVLNCGDNDNEWHGDNINSFTRKVIHDSLTLDQATFEIIRNRGGEPCEFIATDGATYRIADTHNDEKNQSINLKKGEKNGYLPYYVQVYQSRILAEFYPWELCFGVRNPSSSILSNGYGRSELEDLIENVTSMLNADQYNANYFKVGSNPKGILKVTGNINQGRIEEFKNHWQAQMAGTRNAHKMMIIEADKMDFINTQASNKDMEYGKYQEFLIKIACAHYKIDPSEIGFNMQGESGSGGGFGKNDQEDKVKYSKDKGLKPLVKAYNAWLQKYIIDQKDPDYEIVLEGLDVETPDQELDNDVKAITNWSTVNEIRRKRGLEDIEGGDIILNPIFLQNQMASMQGNQDSNQYMDQSQQSDQEKEENPFTKSLEKDLERLFAKAV